MKNNYNYKTNIIFNMTNEELDRIKLKHINENTKVYNENKELIELYDKYISNVVELFDYLRDYQESDFYYTIVFDILIEVGFFSADRVFNYKNIDFNEVSIKRGLNIINGEGICRNIACFYEDVFSYFYNYPLKMCCFYNEEEISRNAMMYGNHAINLTYHNDVLYGFDLTNHHAYIPVSQDLLKGLGNNNVLTYTPGGNLLFKLTTILNKPKDLFDELDKITKLLLENSKLKPMSEDEYKSLIIKANNFIIEIMERKKILQNFMIQNEELTHEIKNKMLLLK